MDRHAVVDEPIGQDRMKLLRRHADSQSGAAAIEFAILAPLVLAIAFGVLSGGLAWNTKQTLTHATREAVRYAATKPSGVDDATWETWLRDVAATTVDASFGELNDGQPGRTLCIAYVGDGATRRLVIGPGDPTTDMSGAGTVTHAGHPCYADGRASDEPRVQAYLRRETSFIAVLYNRTDLPMESRAVARYERAGRPETE